MVKRTQSSLGAVKFIDLVDAPFANKVLIRLLNLFALYLIIRWLIGAEGILEGHSVLLKFSGISETTMTIASKN